MYLILILITEIKAIDNTFQSFVVSDYKTCVSEMIRYNFDNPGLLFFTNTYNVSSTVASIRSGVLKDIHENIKYSVQVVSSKRKDETNFCDENIYMDEQQENLQDQVMDKFEAVSVAKYFVIIIENYKDFCKLTGRLTSSRSWNPYAKFIIFLINFHNCYLQNMEIAEKIVNNLYRHNVGKAVVILPQIDGIHEAHIYGYKKYDPPKYCGYANETAKNRLTLENICERGRLKYSKPIFNTKIPTDMKGCNLQIIALEKQPFVSKNVQDPNIEMMLINEVVKRYNFSPNYKIINIRRGEKGFKGVWDGALKELITKEGQVLLGGIYPDDEVHEDFECTTSYLDDSYTWVVPRALPSPAWIALTIIFQKTVWLLLTLVFLICVLTWKVLGQLSDENSHNKTIVRCFLNAWVLCLGFPAHIPPMSHTLRLFFVFYNIYCVLCLTAYQTKLFDVLTYPSFEDQIKNVEQLVESGLKFGGSEELHDLFMNTTDPFDNFLGEQWIDVDDITTAFIDVVVHRNFSILCSRLELAHISATLPELSDAFGNYKYYAFKSNVFTVYLETVSLKGFAFIENFSKTLSMLRQIGVNTFIRHNFAVYNMRKRANLLQSLDLKKTDIRALSMLHLQGGFYVIFLGYICGVITLLVEIILHSSRYKIIMTTFQKLFK